MTSNFVRSKFIEKYGEAKYKEFVLSLYDIFPRADNLLFWQEKLIVELTKELGLSQPNTDDVFNIFNYCPVHNVELLDDNVPIINGMELKEPLDINLRKQLFPLANVNAPRYLDRFEYPKSIDIKYCPSCRDARLNKINSA